ncbi:MAG TPA: hypothetical protein VEK57_17420 [Thermoanaerobaculia bacterium]|nr:hypothetical protein [Thermoanaerobaculia bacterium]
MAQLIVDDIKEELVEELNLRAARNGQSPAEELRQILQRALAPPNGIPSFKEMIEQMPEIDDEYLERVVDYGRPVDL